MTSHAPSFPAAIARLHAAMAKVANGDISAIKALYAHTDDATSFYGWGGYEKGWAAVSKRWDWAGQQFKGGSVSYENVTAVVSSELAYTTEIETFEARMAGMDRPTRWSNRVTHIFRLEEGEWRLVHRHANRLEEQYTPSTRLKGS
jgi:ketosteroid isomerase-like protein